VRLRHRGHRHAAAYFVARFALFAGLDRIDGSFLEAGRDLGQLGTPGLEGQGAVLSLLLLLILLIPVVYYVIATNREAASR
jgi:ABC-type spermidine/putrescine transport system permease subunit I